MVVEGFKIRASVTQEDLVVVLMDLTPLDQELNQLQIQELLDYFNMVILVVLDLAIAPTMPQVVVAVLVVPETDLHLETVGLEDNIHNLLDR
jgi:hypothetical protein